jgi:hypothetical protein
MRLGLQVGMNPGCIVHQSVTVIGGFSIVIKMNSKDTWWNDV